jgi:hypothetical protein
MGSGREDLPASKGQRQGLEGRAGELQTEQEDKKREREKKREERPAQTQIPHLADQHV